ncbi:MAG: cyclase family protein [Anaerolineales bacterium]|nr:cyclase family protein [Anaerolineales bacterium]MCS7246867.1 cyclase family protein [Anaerolineales bacterium]MDW8160677.1 cyclase family protein [Anaerolineales bacterium]MDW8446908.1 cyclase family protein [Anaerolineales bacterium]
MNIYDITLTLSPEIPTWPGDPKFVMERFDKIEAGDNTNTTRIEMSAHTGTHVDAPYHFFSHGKGVDQLSLRILNGRAYVLHLPEVSVVTAAELARVNIPPRTRRLLIRTRNSEYWAAGVKEFRTDFVGLSADAADYLVRRGVKLIGVDYLSVAPYKQSRPTHEVFLRNDVIIVEGLNLAEVPQGRYMLYCLPLKLKGADGAPARAILIGV